MLLSLATYLQSLPISSWLRQSSWAYPTLETIHILSLGLLIGSVTLVDLAVLRSTWAKQAPADQPYRRGQGAEPIELLARQALPLAWFGFALAACTGLAMLVSRPMDLLLNPLLQLKLIALLLAGLNAAFFHLRQGLLRIDPISKFQALLSLLLWGAVLALGRWVAYV